jgi:branched-chain amino acid transport system substrate-binding protein
MNCISSASPNRPRILLLAVLAAVICSSAGCSDDSSPTPTVVNSAPPALVATVISDATQQISRPTAGQTPPGSAAGTATPGGATFSGDMIKIGVDLPISFQGTTQPDIVAVRDAAQLAIEQANAAGGVTIAGKTYRLQMYDLDDEGDYGIAQKNAEIFVADPAVLAVVGPFNSLMADGDMPIFNVAGLAHVSPANTAPALTIPQYGKLGSLRPTGKLTYFRVLTYDDIQAPAGADYMYEKLKVRKLYILDDLSPYAENLADNLARRFREDGGTVVGRENLTPEAQNYQALVKKIADAKPDAVYFAGTRDHGPDRIRRQMVATGLNIPFVGPDGILHVDFTNLAGTAAEGSYATAVGVNPAALPAAGQFLADYKARFGKAPTIQDLSSYSPTAYDAANIIIAALRKAHAPDRESVRRAIAATRDYQGVLGVTSFDQNGDTSVRLVSIYKVVSGEWTWIDQIDYQGTLP